MLTTFQIHAWLRYVVLWGITIFLLVWALRKQDLSILRDTLLTADYSWAVAIAFITASNHWMRAKRWQMVIAPIQHIRTAHIFLALMFGYLITYIIPRAGEVARCASLQRTDKLPIQTTFGTVITERVIDLLSLLIVSILALLLEWKTLLLFFQTYLQEPVFVMIEKLLSYQIGLLITLSILSFILVWIIAYWLKKKQRNIIGKIVAFMLKMKEGIFSIRKMHRKWLFMGYTLYIWFTYWLMTYWWFFSFASTSYLAPSVGLAMMTVSSLGRLIPVQGGGMGAYHYLFSQAMLLFGVPLLYGNALAILVHGFQSVYYIVVGSICSFILFRKF